MSEKSDLVSHLEMIQATVERLSSISVAIKGATITLASALLATAKDNEFVWFLAYFPIFAFWMLDAYYLSMERNYRRLFDDVRHGNKGDFDMDAGKSSISKTFFTWTVAVFYGFLLAVLTVFVVVVRLVGIQP